MITINAYKAPINNVNTNYDILSVRYIVSKDPAFLDITKQILDVTKLKADTSMLMCSVNYEFTTDEPVYSKVIYAYPGSILEESTVCRCNPDQTGFSFNNNIVSTPKINIKGYLTHSNMPTGDFTIEVSEMVMFMGHGEHTSTTYRILNSSNKVEFESEKDTFNLLSIDIPANTLKENSLYTIEVIQHNNYDSESYASILSISTTGMYNLYNISEDSLKLYDKGISTFTFSQSLAGFKYASINVLDYEGKTILEDFITSSNIVRLPVLNMEAGSRYYILVKFAFTNHDGDIVFTDITRLTGICASYIADSQYYPDYTYNNIFNIIKYDYLDSFIGGSNLLKGVAEQLPNGDIPFYNITSASTIEIRFYKYTGNTLMYTGRGFTVSTVYPVVATEGVNIFLAEDKTAGLYRLLVSYIVINASVKSNEISSFVFNLGEYNNIDITVAKKSLNIPGKDLLLSNSKPIMEYGNSTVLFGSIPNSTADKNNIHSVDKKLNSFSNVVYLYDADTVVNNSISMFPLDNNEALIIHTDKNPHTYGIFNRESNGFINKGSIPGALQNLANNVSLNKFYGYTRLDGKVLLIPNTSVAGNFNIFIYDRVKDTFSELINNKNLLIPNKYKDSALITSRVFSIELNNGNFLALISGTSASHGTFTDIWEFK